MTLSLPKRKTELSALYKLKEGEKPNPGDITIALSVDYKLRSLLMHAGKGGAIFNYKGDFKLTVVDTLGIRICAKFTS